MFTVLETRGMIQYLYTVDKDGSIRLQKLSTDKRLPMRHDAKDKLGRWDELETFGSDWNAFREHFRVSLRNAHGHLHWWDATQQRADRAFPISLIAFGESDVTGTKRLPTLAKQGAGPRSKASGAKPKDRRAHHVATIAGIVVLGLILLAYARERGA